MDIATILQDEYGLTNLRTTPISYGLVDKNYQVTSTEGEFFFKAFRSISAQNYDQLHHDLRVLKQAGIPVPVEVIPRKTGNSSGNFYALYDLVKGKRYNSSIGHMKAVAQVFGKVVQVGLPQRAQLSTQHLINELSHTEQKLTTLARTETWPPEIRQLCQEFGQLSRDVNTKLRKCLPEKLDSLPLHPDFTERNLLFTEDTVVLLCDWQGYGPRILLDEVSSALSRFGTPAPFEGYLLKERMLSFQQILTQDTELIGTVLEEYAQAFPWLLIRRQLCNTPFRVCGLSGTAETKALLRKVLLWSQGFVEWVLNNQANVRNMLL